ncbi:putative peroxin 22-like protein [Rosellinia necatrix]|uniref:Putative peroxin 22-like protein n=1 Tax=Rosellinia necatrix TaxID=77044 RepID=A0A1S7UK81_ROSNE|nr:putative peroxin 22-like protein [Rosellinia necatrix]
MSSSYESSRSRRRGVWSHWVPLAVTVTIAAVGVAAWAWSQRSNEEEEGDVAPVDLDYENADYGENPPYGADAQDPRRSVAKPSGAGDSISYGVGEVHPDVHPEASGAAAGWGAQMSGALRRTPSPQQLLSNAGKTVAAGVAGVGAAVGSALAAIREEDRNAYADHETWSEEAEARKEKPSSKSSPRPYDSGRRRKTVVIVVSADASVDDFDEVEFHEHASILSHIPKTIDFSKIKLFVLIYAPGIKEVGPETPAPITGDETKSPLLTANSAHSTFNAAYSQALALVEKETMVMPFTTAGGYIHMLRHLEPEVLYLQASLAGENGGLVTQLQSWLRHDVILVVGADGGHGGLADSESEAESPEKSEPWWQKEERVGRGRGVVVVDSLRVGDDWSRRIQGNE